MRRTRLLSSRQRCKIANLRQIECVDVGILLCLVMSVVHDQADWSQQLLSATELYGIVHYRATFVLITLDSFKHFLDSSM